MTPYQHRLNRYIDRMAKDMKIRNMAQSTIDAYTWHVTKFCEFFDSPPENLGPEEIRQYQLFMIEQKKSPLADVYSLLPPCFDTSCSKAFTCLARTGSGLTAKSPPYHPHNHHDYRASNSESKRCCRPTSSAKLKATEESGVQSA